MRKTYRPVGNKDYWQRRWEDVPADSEMTNEETYPLKYALMTVSEFDGPILEAGCGAGRILRYFHNRGYDVVGIDFIDVAIEKLLIVDKSLKVGTGDITNLSFADASFKYVLAFGLFHNMETNLDEAIAETSRVLVSGGKLCASFRADNIQTRLTDSLANLRSRIRSKDARMAFHKLNLSRHEFINFFENAGFIVEKVAPVENMPVLYQFNVFRADGHKEFDESKARVEGYRLNKSGKLLQHVLMRLFPNQFCNLYVMLARKP